MTTTVEFRIQDDQTIAIDQYAPRPVGFKVVGGERYFLDVYVHPTFEVLGLNTFVEPTQIQVLSGIPVAGVTPVDLYFFRSDVDLWCPVTVDKTDPWRIEFEAFTGVRETFASLVVWVTRRRYADPKMLKPWGEMFGGGG